MACAIKGGAYSGSTDILLEILGEIVHQSPMATGGGASVAGVSLGIFILRAPTTAQSIGGRIHAQLITVQRRRKLDVIPYFNLSYEASRPNPMESGCFPDYGSIILPILEIHRLQHECISHLQRLLLPHFSLNSGIRQHTRTTDSLKPWAIVGCDYSVPRWDPWKSCRYNVREQLEMEHNNIEDESDSIDDKHKHGDDFDESNNGEFEGEDDGQSK